MSSGSPAALCSLKARTKLSDTGKISAKRGRKDWPLLLWKGKKRMSERNEHKAMSGVERVRESPSVVRYSMMQ